MKTHQSESLTQQKELVVVTRKMLSLIKFYIILLCGVACYFCYLSWPIEFGNRGMIFLTFIGVPVFVLLASGILYVVYMILFWARNSWDKSRGMIILDTSDAYSGPSAIVLLLIAVLIIAIISNTLNNFNESTPL